MPSPFGYFSTVSPGNVQLCTAMYSCHFKGKGNFCGQQCCAQTSAAPPADCPIPPAAMTGHPPPFLGAPATSQPKPWQQGERRPTQETPSLTQSLSASALPAACVTEECQRLLSCSLQVYFYSLGKPNPGNTKIHIIHDGLHMTLSPFSQNTKLTISWHFTVLPINIHSVRNELLDAV